MPQFTVNGQPPAEFKVGQAISIEAEFTSSNLKTGLLYMASIDILGPDGKENGRACRPQTCSAVQTPAAGKPQKLNFSFRNITVSQEGTWHFHIALHSRKDHLGNDFSYLGDIHTRQVTVKK
jgi:hypothetical protein